MKDEDRERSLIEVARDAIDEDEIEAMFELTTDKDCDPDAVRALHEVTAKTLVRDLRISVEHARIRGRDPSGDDVGDAIEQFRGCCGQTTMQLSSLPTEPLHAEWVD